MITTLDTVPENTTLGERIDELERKIDAQTEAINQLIDFTNGLTETINGFSGNIPPAFAAMLGLNK